MFHTPCIDKYMTFCNLPRTIYSIVVVYIYTANIEQMLIIQYAGFYLLFVVVCFCLVYISTCTCMYW